MVSFSASDRWLRSTRWLLGVSVCLAAVSQAGFGFAQTPDETGNRLHQVVKVFFDKSTNGIVLVGAKEDVAVVKRTILMLNERFSERSHTVTEKISLNFQLAETVADILSNSIALETNRISRLKIHPLHFPESILLVGPENEVEQAKRLIRSMDNHPGFPLK